MQEKSKIKRKPKPVEKFIPSSARFILPGGKKKDPRQVREEMEKREAEKKQIRRAGLPNNLKIEINNSAYGRHTPKGMAPSTAKNA